jgi:hypothetical protein
MKITRRHVLGLIAGAAALIGVPSVWIYKMKTYAGPVSDHFDGMRFFDPDGVPPKSLGDVLRWQFGPGRERLAWPDWAPSPHADIHRRGSTATRCGCRLSVMPAG